MHTETFKKETEKKIYYLVDNTELKVTPKFKSDFEAEFNPRTYSNKTNYGYSVLEFIFKRTGIGAQQSWEHDTIFKFAPDIKIDWKRVCPKYGTAPITTITAAGNSTKNRDVTHYGFVNFMGNPFEVGSVLKFKLLDFKDKEYVWNNPFRHHPTFFTYRPQKNAF